MRGFFSLVKAVTRATATQQVPTNGSMASLKGRHFSTIASVNLFTEEERVVYDSLDTLIKHNPKGFGDIYRNIFLTKGTDLSPTASYILSQYQLKDGDELSHIARNIIRTHVVATDETFNTFKLRPAPVKNNDNTQEEASVSRPQCSQ